MVFVFRPRSRETHRHILLAGLDNAYYRVHFEGQPVRVRIAGATLERQGLDVALPHPDSAAVIDLQRVR